MYISNEASKNYFQWNRFNFVQARVAPFVNFQHFRVSRYYLIRKCMKRSVFPNFIIF